jgi:hypothetical protein
MNLGSGDKDRKEWEGERGTQMEEMAGGAIYMYISLPRQ